MVYAPTAVNGQQRGSILQPGPISNEMHVKLMNEMRESCNSVPTASRESLETATAVDGEPIDRMRKMDKPTCQCPSLALGGFLQRSAY